MEKKIKKLIKYMELEREKAREEALKHDRIGKTAHHFYNSGVSMAFSDAISKCKEIFDM